MNISVIIPTYKPQAYIWECLDSLVAQTFPRQDFEVIIVLNGCDEPWRSQIEEYITRKMRGMNVNFIKTEETGVSNARNLALDAARGEYVAFIDDDDYVSPKYLEGLYEISSSDTIGLCYPYAFDDGKPEVQLKDYPITIQYEKLCSKGKIIYPRARKYFSGPWMKLIHMSFIHGRRFDPRFKNGEDSLFMFLVSDKFKYVSFGNKEVCYYRRYRENSAVTRMKSYGYRLSNSFHMIIEYCKMYFRAPWRYDIGFFITRILAACR